MSGVVPFPIARAFSDASAALTPAVATADALRMVGLLAAAEARRIANTPGPAHADHAVAAVLRFGAKLRADLDDPQDAARATAWFRNGLSWELDRLRLAQAGEDAS